MIEMLRRWRAGSRSWSIGLLSGSAELGLHFLIAAALASDSPGTQTKSFGVREMVEMSFIGPPYQSADDPAIVPSPDARRFFFMRRRADLAADAQVAELHVYDVAAVREALTRRDASSPAPFISIETRTDSDGESILKPRWLDSERIVFKGQATLDEPYQISTFNVRTGVLSHLSAARSKSEVISDFEVSGEGLIYRQFRRIPNISGEKKEPYFVNFEDFRSSVLNLKIVKTENALFASYGQGQPWQLGNRFLAVNGKSDFLITRFFVSPSGKRAVIRMPVELIPPSETLRVDSAGALVEGRSSEYRLLSVDLRSGEYRTLMTSPAGVAAERRFLGVLWEPDETHVIVVGERPPATLGLGTGSEQEGQLPIIRYRLDGDGAHILGSLPSSVRVRAVKWIKHGTSFEVSTPTSREVFSRQGRLWTRVSASPASRPSFSHAFEAAGDFKVFVREDASTPPHVVAAKGQKEITLGPRDEVLQGVYVTPVEPVTWSDERGGELRGGLLLPRTWRLGTRLPVVIQIINRFPLNRFLPGGYEPVATFAAQALASEGFAVLQLDCQGSGLPYGVEEGPAVVRALDGAVDYLERRGIADRSRIGIVGHSRTAYRVLYAITNPGRTKFAAAIANEGFTGSYVGYLLNTLAWNDDVELVQKNFHEQFVGGQTFWRNKDGWLSTAPGFNLEKVTSPLLLTMGANGYDEPTLIYDLEIYVGLKALNKPVDYLYFPKGSHVMRWPRGRFASQQATVDWMKFWLKGEASTVADRQARDERWAKLRELAKEHGMH